ncbi:MAG: hypothetical protein FWC50_04845 [Planctomycetaceae bacterium]|nr:hypothetical protein [Planctomycetaceae bacterium]
MIIEKAVPSIGDFLQQNGVIWLLAMIGLCIVTLFVSFLVSVARYGFAEGFWAFGRGCAGTAGDIFCISWRRIWAIARLAIKESLRKRVLFICVTFLVILMFAGWFLDKNSTDPTAIYLSFVLSMSTYLILLLALFLSAFSLPNDIKTKTIYTIVTKPVRSSEIVLGRILGFSLIGTVLLVFMAVLSYVFVSFQLQHTHVLTEQDLIPAQAVSEEIAASGEPYITHSGSTRVANGHRHRVDVYSDNSFFVETVNGHTHTVEKIVPKAGTDDSRPRFVVGTAEGMLQARVPRYATSLVFRDTDGIDREKGIDVGHEWNYRYYVGNFTNSTKDAGIFTFEGISPSRYVDGLPVEMTLGVYRSYKGDMEKPIKASISVRNPINGLSVEVTVFPTEKFITKSLFIPRELRGRTATVVQREAIDPNNPAGLHIVTPAQKDESLAQKRDFDLFEDFVVDGKLEIWIRCVENQQFIGVAKYDLYLREADAHVFPNFFKGYFGIWQQMIMVVSFGVLFSTFLGGPVTMVALFGLIIAGFAKTLLLNVAFGKNLGGGAFESLVRMLTQTNLMDDMSKGFGTSLILLLDKISGGILIILGQIIPPLYDFTYYEQALQAGFNIPASWMIVHALTTLGYVLPIFIIGYIILRNREVAK